jgi:segregation and condensation protein B
MEREQAKKIIDAMLYMTDHPLSEQEILEVLEQNRWDQNDVKEMISELTAKYDAAESPLQIVQVAGGVQVASRSSVAPWIRRLYKERLTVRLSPSALETLSIIAYKQPITRLEIEQIRGVEASGVMETLLERRLVKIVGRKETIGRPLLYGTTVEFLRHAGLRHLSELPDLNSLIPAEPTPEATIPVEAAPEEVLVGAEASAVPTEGDPTPNA